jgi:rfaE bifunctional protein kinase chain/domain
MTASELLAKMASMRVLVAGDICLDRWCHYNPALSIPSRETGIPRIAVTSTENTPGAAGTVAVNLRALGVKDVAVLGAIGDDGHAYELRQALAQRGISADLLVTEPGFCTFTYSKLLNTNLGSEDLPRIDFINSIAIPTSLEDRLCSMLEAARDFDLICVSDQAETDQGGVITARMRQRLAELSAKHNQLVWVDSRRRIEQFEGAVLKVNHDEAVEARGRSGAASLQELRDRVNAPALFVTHAGNGIQIIDDDGETWVMTHKILDPVDVCGAGDSFTAGAACALAAGASVEAAARLGHLVASVTIMKSGTGFALPEELLEAERELNQ